MKKIGYLLSSSLFALPMLASAQVDGGFADATTFLGAVLTFINATLILFILGVGFLLFVWGMFLYFIAGGANEEKKEQGKSLLIYATLGFVVIIVFWGIVNLVAAGIGGEDDTLDVGQVVGVEL